MIKEIIVGFWSEFVVSPGPWGDVKTGAIPLRAGAEEVKPQICAEGH